MSIRRGLVGVFTVSAVLLAAWPVSFGGRTGDGAAVLPSRSATEQTGSAHPPATDPAALPGPSQPSEKPAFAEECTGVLRPEWRPLYVVGDAGHGLDSDFLGDLRQVSIVDGLCTITAARASTPSGRLYASAGLSTMGGFAQRFGTFEIRVRYPSGQGIWPAFWLLEQGDRVSTPPEIDIFEAYPGDSEGRSPNEVASTLHYRGGSHHFIHDHGSDLTVDFHIHRLVWSPGLLAFSIDGVETGRITRDVPDVPMYPILNLAVGADGFRADSTTPDVATMEIDYVRIWAP